MTNKPIMPKPPVFSHHKYRPVADMAALASEGFKLYAAQIGELTAELAIEETRLDGAIAKLAELQDEHRDLQAAASALCSVLLLEESKSAFARKIKICIKDLATLLADYDPTPE